MIQRRTCYNQFVLRWGLVGLLLAASAVAVQAQILPLPVNTTIFFPAENISNNAGSSFFHSIVVGPEGNIYLVWLDDSPGYPAVFFSRSANFGLTFSAPKNLSNDPGGSSEPQIVTDFAGNVNIVWAALSGDQSGFLSRSVDGGTTFSAPINIANGVHFTPLVTVDSSGNIYLSWADASRFHNMFFSRSMDGGATFSVPTQLSNRPPIDSPRPLSIAVDSAGSLNLLWDDCTGDCHIWFSRSVDGGAAFSQKEFGVFDFLPVVGMALDSADNIHIVYNTLPFGEVWLLRSTDGGGTFSGIDVSHDQMNLPPRPSPCCAQIATDSAGNINIVWEDDGSTRGFTITFARSSDGGNSFSRTDVSHTGVSPKIAVDSSGDIHLVWTGPQPNSDIFYSQSSDGGVTFSAPRNLSNNSRRPGSVGLEPLIALDSCGNVNIAWANFTARNPDIFFRRGFTLKSFVRGCVPFIADHGLTPDQTPAMLP